MYVKTGHGNNKEFAWPCLTISLIVCILRINHQLTSNLKTYNTCSTGFEMLKKSKKERNYSRTAVCDHLS